MNTRDYFKMQILFFEDAFLNARYLQMTLTNHYSLTSKPRGRVLKDYMDRFLDELYKILTDKDDKDENLAMIVEANRIDFEPYYGEEGWRDFIHSNMLEYYCDEKFIPIVTSKCFTYWRNRNTPREEYLAECERYLDYAERIIRERAERIVELLHHML